MVFVTNWHHLSRPPIFVQTPEYLRSGPFLCKASLDRGAG
jgi:hypothetical protein